MSATEKYECPLIEINRYLSLQIQTHTKNFLSFQIIQTISWTLGSAKLGFSPLLCPLYSLSKFSCFFIYKLMFLLITFLFISLFNLKRFERNTNKMSNKNLLNLLLPENPLVIFIKKRCFLIGRRKKNPHHCLSLLSLVSSLGYPTNWLLGLGELLHVLLLLWINTITYNNGIKLRRAWKKCPFLNKV